MQRYRFDQKTIVVQAIVEMIKRGVPASEMDIYLSRMGPVDLDMLQQCMDEVYAYIAQEEEREQELYQDRAVA
ncbi:hypothetical protein KHQ08_02160 [Pseudochrobactrum algeriensis]|uniref:Uncharacterized protein n=1 Tax=Pseudochrobactrum saccharolyticum TaxID=354352 RepID=A0A7W8AHE4_9HYPH|nr:MULTISPECIES: hypothetical protein [Pseudochrobactrum]MBX8782249.1 hypothetical protein [Ochrobactrum sp. GRS2]MBX8813250.1 hypothetical protein [Ochrobactrum sp. MR34]KAB0540714.1 hypothetical protein F7P81_05005 [Pseudochrobactrum saccharolyticum]MBB5090290.1 hypothetical protein [Pseudochrobactrum saccharolyticum]MDP8252193.1 hypothetical protein [Pseudochrobactrum saccharolyticum]